MTPLDAMKHALEAMQSGLDHRKRFEVCGHLRTAIAEMEKAEPVAWGVFHEDGSAHIFQQKETADMFGVSSPLFTHPAQSRDSIIEECAGICDRFGEREMHPYECAAAIRALKGK